jgi:hypothetical protein
MELKAPNSPEANACVRKEGLQNTHGQNDQGCLASHAQMHAHFMQHPINFYLGE